MTDTEASGVIAHQDYGTGLADGESRDPTNAAFFAAGDNVASDYVQSGLDLTADFNNNTLDISSGTVILEYDGSINVTLSPTDDPSDFNTQWNGNIAFPVSVDAVTGISLDDNSPNHVYIFLDETSNDSITYRTGSFVMEPTPPYLKIGEVDTEFDTVTSMNRSPDMTFGDATVENNLSVQGQADEQGDRVATRPWVNNNSSHMEGHVTPGDNAVETVTFNEAFSSTPSVSTSVYSGGVDYNISEVTSVSTTSVDVNSWPDGSANSAMVKSVVAMEHS